MRSMSLRPVALVSLLAGGCAAEMGEMPTWVGFHEDNVEGADDRAVVVLKVVPPAQVLLAAGSIGPDGWRGKGPRSRVWLAAPDGYVVAQVSPTQDAMAYAVIRVRPDGPAREGPGTSPTTSPTTETEPWSVVPADAGAGASHQGLQPAGATPAYGPIGQARIPVLKALARRVTFVGTIRIDAGSAPDPDQAPAKVGITQATSPDDLAAVRRFLTQHYPKITARVVERPLQLLRWDEATAGADKAAQAGPVPALLAGPAGRGDH